MLPQEDLNDADFTGQFLGQNAKSVYLKHHHYDDVPGLLRLYLEYIFVDIQAADQKDNENVQHCDASSKKHIRGPGDYNQEEKQD